MTLGTISTLLGIVTVAVGATVFINKEHKDLDEKHVDAVVYEQAQQQLLDYLQQSEQRGQQAEVRILRREIRQLENIEDERSLTNREKAYKRELEEQLEVVQ